MAEHIIKSIAAKITLTFQQSSYITRWFGLLFLIALMHHARAEHKDSTEANIRSLEQQVVKGILEADTNLLQRLWAPEFLVNTPRNTIAKTGRLFLKHKKRVSLIIVYLKERSRRSRCRTML